MATFIRHRVRVTDVSYVHAFWWRNDPHAGFSFPCDEHGNVNESTLQPAGLANYRDCVDGTYDVEDGGVVMHRNSYTVPAAISCVRCKREVDLYGFTNTCECGADYNMSGQLLGPRSNWGEETGESLSDILNIP